MTPETPTAPATPAPPSETPRTDALDWSCANSDTKQTKDTMQANLDAMRKLERELNALKSAPATPALSQIRSELKHLAEVHAGPGLSNTGVVKLLACATSLLSIADMLDAENAKLKKGLVEVVDYCEKEMQPWENEGIPAYDPSIVDLHNIALSALRGIAQMEEGV